VETTAGQARLRVGRDTDLAAVAAAAQHTGEVIAFAYQPPTLSELFRQAVAA
jgi:ABC-2 type transport system ATP-binding protein